MIQANIIELLQKFAEDVSHPVSKNDIYEFILEHFPGIDPEGDIWVMVVTEKNYGKIE